MFFLSLLYSFSYLVYGRSIFIIPGTAMGLGSKWGLTAFKEENFLSAEYKTKKLNFGDITCLIFVPTIQFPV